VPTNFLIFRDEILRDTIVDKWSTGVIKFEWKEGVCHRGSIMQSFRVCDFVNGALVITIDPKRLLQNVDWIAEDLPGKL
jgi:hypothetical protein